MNGTTLMKTKIYCCLICSLMLIMILSELSYAQEDQTSDIQRQKVIRLIEDGYNQKQFEVIAELVWPDYVEVINGVRTDSSITIKRTIDWLSNRVPEYHLTPIMTICENGLVAVQWIYKGFNEKYKKEVVLHGVYIAKFKEGKIAEGWQYFDNHQRYQQLGFKLEIP